MPLDKPQNDSAQGWHEVTIGRARLILGDCRDVLPALASESIDMIWTDPPYGHNNGVGDALSIIGKIKGDGSKTTVKPIANDDADSMREVVDAMLVEASRLLKQDCCCCCCCGGGGPRPTFAWLAQRMDERGLSFFHSVIWDKKNPGIGWRYRRQHEMIMVAHRKGGKLAWNEDVPAMGNILSFAKPTHDQFHTNQKPIELPAKQIEAHCIPDGVVLDPFMGSGTTGVAAVQLGRDFIGIELDPEHFETACKRIEDAQRQGDLFLEGAA